MLEKHAKTELSFENQRENARELAVETNNKLREYNEAYYDQVRKPTKYTKGQYVLVRDLQKKVGIYSKLKSMYKGPYQINKILNKNRYVVTDIPDFNIKQRPYNSILSSDKLKPWIKPLSNNKPEN
jgi:hypothetical protein